MDNTVFTSKNIKSLNTMCPAATSVKMGDTLKEMDLKIKSKIPVEVSNTTELNNYSPELINNGVVILPVSFGDEDKVECCVQLVFDAANNAYMLYISCDQKNWTLKLDSFHLTGENASIYTINRQGGDVIVLSAFGSTSLLFLNLYIDRGMLDYDSYSIDVVSEGFRSNIKVENNELFSLQTTGDNYWCYHLNEDDTWDNLVFSNEDSTAQFRVLNIVCNGEDYIFFVSNINEQAQVFEAYKTSDFLNFENIPVGRMAESFSDIAYNKGYIGISEFESKAYFSYDLKNWNLSYDFKPETINQGILCIGSQTGIVTINHDVFDSLYLYTTSDFIKWEKKKIGVIDLEHIFDFIYSFGKIDENLQSEIVVTAMVFNNDNDDAKFVSYFSISNEDFIPMGYEPNNTIYYRVYSKEDKTVFLSNEGIFSPASKIVTVSKDGTYVQDDGRGVFKYLEDSDNNVKLGITSTFANSNSGILVVNLEDEWTPCMGKDGIILPNNFADVKRVLPTFLNDFDGSYVAITEDVKIYGSKDGQQWFYYASLISDLKYLVFNETTGLLFFNKKNENEHSYCCSIGWLTAGENYWDDVSEITPFGEWCYLDTKDNMGYLCSFNSVYKLMQFDFFGGASSIMSTYKGYGYSQLVHNKEFFVALIKEDGINGLAVSKDLKEWSFIDLSNYSKITCIANVFDEIWFCTESGENRFYSLNIEYLLNSGSISDTGGGISLDSPAFTGIPTTPTPESNAPSNQIVNTQYVQNVLSNSPFLGGNPTVPIVSTQTENNEIAATKYVANKLREYSNSPAFTGTPTTPTPTSGRPSEQIANTAYVVNELNTFGEGMMQEVSRNIETTLQDSPILGGIPTAPTAEKGTSTTQIATTEFVANAIGGGGGASESEAATLGGKYWNYKLFDTLDQAPISCMNYLNDKFIVAGEFAKKYSYDGLNWILCNTIPNMISMAYGKGIYVGISNLNDGMIYTSLDGLVWTGTSNDKIVALSTVCFCNDAFIICHQSGCIMSYNGVQWENVVLPTVNNNGNNYTYIKAAYGNGKYNIITWCLENYTYKYYFLSSEDLSTWNSLNLPLNSNLNSADIICANNKIAVVGSSGIYYNTDGADWGVLSSWGHVDFNLNYSLSTICQGNGVFVTMDNLAHYIIYSTDIVNWTIIENESKLDFVQCAYGNGIFIGYGGGNGTSGIVSSKATYLQNSNKETFSTTGLVSNVINLLNNKTGYIVSENDLVAPYTLKTGALYFYCVYTNGVPRIEKVYFGINDVGYLMISNEVN